MLVDDLNVRWAVQHRWSCRMVTRKSWKTTQSPGFLQLAMSYLVPGPGENIVFF